jgi:2-succinyl-6-hydroxy-2,4-cyclohexadiene-1-carboxylate synthase
VNAAPDTPQVVFVPGFMQPGETWRAVAERLPERYRGVVFEHGRHTFEGRLEEIATAGAGVGPTVLCGYSLGGRLALHAALRAPGGYAALVTVGASAGIEAPAARSARAEADDRLAGWIETQPIEDVVAIWERQPLFADQSEALVEAQRPGRLSQDPHGLSTLLRTAGQGAVEPVWERLHTLTMPVLTLAGALDERYRDAGRRIARAVPRGRTEAIENAGHAPHLQRPDAVADRLLDFLDEHFAKRLV